MIYKLFVLFFLLVFSSSCLARCDFLTLKDHFPPNEFENNCLTEANEILFFKAVSLLVDENRGRSIIHTKNSKLYRNKFNYLLSALSRKQTISANSIYSKTVFMLLNELKLIDYENYFNDACLSLKERVIFNQNNLNSKNTFLVIHSTPKNKKFIILINSKKIIFKSANKKLLKKSLKNIRVNFGPRKSGHFDTQVKSELLFLYKELFEPFKKEIQMNSNVYIIPDASTGIIPFDMLWDGSDFLLNKDYYFIHVPSLSNSYLTTKAESYNRVFLATNSDKIYKEDSKHAKDSILQENYKIIHEISGERLNKIDLNNALISNDFDVIHLSSHAEYKKNYAESFIKMSANEKLLPLGLEQMLLAASANSAPKLMVLAACETAKDEGNGDHAASLGLAGIAARSGVSQVVATLWDIESEQEGKPSWVSFFYKNLSKTGSPSFALKKTKRDIDKHFRGRFRDFDESKNEYGLLMKKWGALVLIGGGN